MQPAQRRRVCFLMQVVAGFSVILLQLVDVITYHGFDSDSSSSVETVIRIIVPGLWAGAVFTLVGGIHLYWKPQTTAALTLSFAAQVAVAIVVVVMGRCI